MESSGNEEAIPKEHKDKSVAKDSNLDAGLLKRLQELVNEEENSQVFCKDCNTCVNVDESQGHFCRGRRKILRKYCKIVPDESPNNYIRVEYKSQKKRDDLLDSILKDIETTNEERVPEKSGKDEVFLPPLIEVNNVNNNNDPNNNNNNNDWNNNNWNWNNNNNNNWKNNNNSKRVSFVDLTYEKEDLKCSNCSQTFASYDEAECHLLGCTFFSSIQ